MIHGRNLFPVSVAALALCLGASTFDISVAHAERRSTLDGAPAVRHRLLLVKKRFEISLAGETSINTDFRHTTGFGGKLEYHFSDMFSAGVTGFYGISYNTALTDRILKSPLPSTATEGDPTPTAQQFREHLNDIPLHGAAYISVTPWYGKLAAFGAAFLNFDFYFQGGVAFAKLENRCCNFTVDQNPGVLDPEQGLVPDDNPNNDPALNDGNRFGIYAGGGIHVFLNDFIALDFTVRDYIFSDNPSGLDYNADLAVTDDDDQFINHLFMGLGVSILLPTDVKRTP